MKYDDYAHLLGFQKEGNVYILEANGFKVYLRDWQYMVLAIPSFYIPLDRPLDKEEIKKVTIASFNNACAPMSLGNPKDTLIVSLPEGNKTKDKKIETMKAMIEEVTKCLKEDGYLPMKLCPICHASAEYGIFGDHYCPIHEDCKNSYIEKLKDKVKEDTGFKASYILSILFAIIGAAIGLLPALFLTIYKYNYFAGLLALVPILATIGFFFAKAPSKKWITITIGCIVFIIVLGFLGFALPYMAKMKELSFVDYMFKNGWVGFRKAIVGLILAFAGFGGAKFLDKFKKNYKKELEKFEE